MQMRVLGVAFVAAVMLVLLITQSVNAKVSILPGTDLDEDRLGSLLGGPVGSNNGDTEPNRAEFDPNGTLTRVNATISNYTNTEHGFTFLLPSTGTKLIQAF